MSLSRRRNAVQTLFYWVFLIIIPWSLADATPPLKHRYNFETPIETLYQAIQFNHAPPSYDVFYRALNGYFKLKKASLI